MFVSDIIDVGYDAGTFKIGQKVYYVKDIVHRFWNHKECPYCKSTGEILVKGKTFTCPNCNGSSIYGEVTERVVDEHTETVKSIISFRNSNKNLEIYINSDSGYGLMIQKDRNGTNRYFATKDEAKKACDEYNSRNSVYALLKKYRENKYLINEN